MMVIEIVKEDKIKKETELGKIPAEWEAIKFGDFTREKSERAKDRLFPVLSVTKYNGIVYAEEYFKKTVASRDTSNYKVVHQNDFAYATIHLDEGSIGLCNFKVGIVSPMYTVFEALTHKVDLRFLFILLKSHQMMNVYQHIGTGGVNRRKSISFKTLSEVTVPLPPLKEQEKIAEILGAADGQIEKTRQLIEKTNELKKGLMQQLFMKGIGHTEFKDTDIGEIPLEWNIKELGEIADVKGGKRLPKGKALLEEVTSRPYIRVSDMYMGGVNDEKILYVPEEVVSTIERYRIFEGEIFISVAGTLGLIGEVPSKLSGANLTENADRICNLKCNKTYLKYYLMSDFVQNVINNEKTTNAQPKLALTRIKTFKIALPNSKEQQKIADILSSVDDQIDIYEKEKEKQLELKKALMQQLLIGKLRVTV